MTAQPRPGANGREHEYALNVEEAASLYEAAGHAHTTRALQKYCARGDLTCIREQTTYGERFRITPASVARHIEQIEELSRAHRREQPRPEANVRAAEDRFESANEPEASVREQPRPDATSDRYFTQLESENVFLRAQNDKKDQQLERRDRQIEAMIQRDQETNFLIKRLSDGIPMLAQPDRPGEEAQPMQYTDIPGETAAERYQGTPLTDQQADHAIIRCFARAS
jgi:hypothetical protein